MNLFLKLIFDFEIWELFDHNKTKCRFNWREIYLFFWIWIWNDFKNHFECALKSLLQNFLFQSIQNRGLSTCKTLTADKKYHNTYWIYSNFDCWNSLWSIVNAIIAMIVNLILKSSQEHNFNFTLALNQASLKKWSNRIIKKFYRKFLSKRNQSNGNRKNLWTFWIFFLNSVITKENTIPWNFSFIWDKLNYKFII